MAGNHAGNHWLYAAWRVRVVQRYAVFSGANDVASGSTT